MEISIYTYRYTVTTRIVTLALRWALVRDKVTRQCPQTTTFQEKGEPKRIRTEVPLLQYQPNALPLGQTGSQSCRLLWEFRYMISPPGFSARLFTTPTVRCLTSLLNHTRRDNAAVLVVTADAVGSRKYEESGKIAALKGTLAVVLSMHCAELSRV